WQGARRSAPYHLLRWQSGRARVPRVELLGYGLAVISRAPVTLWPRARATQGLRGCGPGPTGLFDLPPTAGSSENFVCSSAAVHLAGEATQADSKAAQERTVLLWHGKSLWCWFRFASQIAAAKKLRLSTGTKP